MNVTDLEPQFLAAPVWETAGRLDPGWIWSHVDRIADAAGVRFLCPLCFEANSGPVGTHGVVCWSPSVSQDHDPKPGRWYLRGTGYADLTLVGVTSDSVLLTTKGGCEAHFFVRGGRIKFC